MTRFFLVASALVVAAGAQAQDIVQAGDQMYTDAEALIEEMAARTPITGTAKNVILFVSDGNGVATNYMSRLWAGQQAGGLGDEYVQPFEAFPYLSLVKTYNLNAQTPDSAATAGALNTGILQRFNLINLGPNAVHNDCTTEAANALTLFSDLVTEAGKSVGAVSTARVTHATPAAVYARTANRNWEAAVPSDCTDSRDIALQLMDAFETGTVDLALGGGARNFYPRDSFTMHGGDGARRDGRDLVQEAQGRGIQVVRDRTTMNGAAHDAPVLGLFADSHMAFEVDRPPTQPSLAEMTKMAIGYLSQNEDGYYLEVEAGRVDHANHATNAKRAMTDGKAFADAVALADEMTDDTDTLIIVTADHAHAIAMNGYCGRGTPIDGLCFDIAETGIVHTGEPVLASDGKPFTVIGYLNGASSILLRQEDGRFTAPDGRPEITQEEAQDVDYVQQVLIPRFSESHSGVDVALYAKGPWAHLFDGTVEQNYIFHVMNHAVNAE
ncbi:MAG: alkaline phosphatase [Pseudomonadota bacterium]